MLDEFTQGLVADKERIDALYVASIYSDINLSFSAPIPCVNSFHIYHSL